MPHRGSGRREAEGKEAGGGRWVEPELLLWSVVSAYKAVSA